jgi:hypothetical protein
MNRQKQEEANDLFCSVEIRTHSKEIAPKFQGTLKDRI